MKKETKQFEDLEIWINAQEIVISIYNLTYKQKINKDYGFIDQIRRAAISISNNIAEGFERQSNPELIKFLYYAKGSAGEVRSMLYVAFNLKYINKNELDEYKNKLIMVSTHISNFIKYLKKSKK